MVTEQRSVAEQKLEILISQKSDSNFAAQDEIEQINEAYSLKLETLRQNYESVVKELA
jgi:hypothetical protein